MAYRVKESKLFAYLLRREAFWYMNRYDKLETQEARNDLIKVKLFSSSPHEGEILSNIFTSIKKK